MVARRSMRHVDAFSWLSKERLKAFNRLLMLRQLRIECTNDYDAATLAIDVARQASRLELLDDLLAQLQS